MGKKMTLCEQANHAAERMWPTLSERDGIRRKSVQLWLAGHRANRLTRAERAVVKAAVAYTKHLLNNETGMTTDERIAELGRRKKLWDALVIAVAAYERAKGGAR